MSQSPIGVLTSVPQTTTDSHYATLFHQQFVFDTKRKMKKLARSVLTLHPLVPHEYPPHFPYQYN